jgi:hypothetical protein
VYSNTYAVNFINQVKKEKVMKNRFVIIPKVILGTQYYAIVDTFGKEEDELYLDLTHCQQDFESFYK